VKAYSSFAELKRELIIAYEIFSSLPSLKMSPSAVQPSQAIVPVLKWPTGRMQHESHREKSKAACFPPSMLQRELPTASLLQSFKILCYIVYNFQFIF